VNQLDTVNRAAAGIPQDGQAGSPAPSEQPRFIPLDRRKIVLNHKIPVLPERPGAAPRNYTVSKTAIHKPPPRNAFVTYQPPDPNRQPVQNPGVTRIVPTTPSAKLMPNPAAASRLAPVPPTHPVPTE
jgi:hypothetical protein